MSEYTIRIQKTVVLTKEVTCDTVDQLTEISNDFVKTLRAEDSNATYWAEIIKKDRQPSWMNKMPSQITEQLLEGTKVAVEASLLEKAIIQRTHTKGLTIPQREKLMAQVWFVPADMTGAIGYYLPSPVELYNTDVDFKKFADEKIRAMASHSAPNSKIVAAMSAYEHPQGWLQFKENHTTKPTESTTPKYEGTNIGFSPSVKRVSDA